MIRLLPLIVVVLLSGPGAAIVGAEWTLAGLAGVAVHTRSGFVDLDATSGTSKGVIGVAGGFNRRWYSVEGEWLFAPGFFSAGNDPLVPSSSLATLSVNLIVRAPTPLVFKGVRPFVSVGGGVMRLRSEDAANLFSIDENLAMGSVGAGVAVPIRKRLALSGEARFVRSRPRENATPFGSAYVDFWRVTSSLSFSIRR